MQNITTPETANALKAAGFPQPEFETGQFWYNLFKSPTLIGKSFGEGEFMCHSLESGRSQRMWPTIGEHDVYAPTTMDILRELGGSRYSLVFVSGVDGISGEDYAFFAIREYGETKFTHTNPAEAAGKAFLSKDK